MELESIQKLTKDIKTASTVLSHDEARYLVDAYYQMQDNRIRSAGQIRSQDKDGEPCEVLKWYNDQASTLEKQVGRALDAYSGANPIGVWARSNKGVGPVIAAGLLAHIQWDRIDKKGVRHVVNYAGQIWSFAGLNPEAKWEKKTKRPWNPVLKSLCAFKLGESFVKVSGHEDALYGQLYKARKEFEIKENEAGKHKDRASVILTEKNWKKTTEAYKAYTEGMFPDAHVHRRAVRWVVKVFLSHLHEVGYWYTFKERAPEPYVFSILGHGDKIEVPNKPW